MTEHLEPMLLVAFVVSVTGLLIAGMVELALRLAAARSVRAADGHGTAMAQASGPDAPLGHLARGETNDQDTSTGADEASSAERRK